MKFRTVAVAALFCGFAVTTAQEAAGTSGSQGDDAAFNCHADTCHNDGHWVEVAFPEVEEFYGCQSECIAHPEAIAFQFNPPIEPCGDDCDEPCGDQDAEVVDWMAEELGIAGATTCAEALAGFVVSDDDPETAGQGLCEIWGGYVGNNVCPVTCSMCDGWAQLEHSAAA